MLTVNTPRLKLVDSLPVYVPLRIVLDACILTDTENKRNIGTDFILNQLYR